MLKHISNFFSNGVDYFLAELNYRPNLISRVDERRYILIGTVSGSYDIDIEGVIIESDLEIQKLADTPWLHERLEELTEETVGTFHFDDE